MRKHVSLIFISALVCLMSVSPCYADDSMSIQESTLQEERKSEPGHSRMNLDFFGIGGKIGFVDPEDHIESTMGFGVHADLGTMGPTLKVEGNIDFWSKSQDGRRDGYRYEEYNRDLSLGVTLQHPFPGEGSITPYIGGGFAFHLVKEERDYVRDAPYNDWETSDLHLGIHGVGGAEAKMSRNMSGGLEVRYTLNDPSNFGIFFGVMYFLKR